MCPGRIHIGLTEAELDTPDRFTDVTQLSRADLVACVVRGGTAATTLAATMICARPTGITTFATGGIGGVHRGDETSLDISADPQEIARPPVTVVAAGSKRSSTCQRPWNILKAPVCRWSLLAGTICRPSERATRA
nr:pseudouridine-5'-phosphate glycosidase [Pseudomonas sp. GX19020]